ncbi:unnamed protein product [Pleuronectes platessa]|uniref:Uncharacterized protein n=1 Tax=Pleuronectes platessa TaxID=8262 RepID=A0A9N7V6Z9_PLEPL|nr:unnamed protein product [Pleuronectes platessa]
MGLLWLALLPQINKGLISGLFCVECACSPVHCAGFLPGLQLPPTGIGSCSPFPRPLHGSMDGRIVILCSRLPLFILSLATRIPTLNTAFDDEGCELVAQQAHALKPFSLPSAPPSSTSMSVRTPPPTPPSSSADLPLIAPLQLHLQNPTSCQTDPCLLSCPLENMQHHFSSSPASLALTLSITRCEWWEQSSH